MDFQTHFISVPARRLLRDLKGREIGTIGSPDPEFRESWRAQHGSIFLEVGSREYELSTFSVFSEGYGTSNVLNIRESPKMTKRIQEFPRFAWFKGQVIEEIYVVRDLVELELEHQRSHYVYDQAIILQTSSKLIALFMIREDLGGVALGHEPAGKKMSIVHTQPAPYYTNKRIISSRQAREIRPLEVAWS